MTTRGQTRVPETKDNLRARLASCEAENTALRAELVDEKERAEKAEAERDEAQRGAAARRATIESFKASVGTRRAPLYPVGSLAVIERDVYAGDDGDGMVFEDRVEIARVDEVTWNEQLDGYDYITTVNPGMPDEFRHRCFETSLRPPFVEQFVLDTMKLQSTELVACSEGEKGHETAHSMLALIKSYEHILKERELLRELARGAPRHREGCKKHP